MTVDPEEVISQAQASNLGYLQHWIKLARQQTPSPLVQEAIDNVLQHLGESRDFRAFSAFALAWFEKLLRTLQDDSSQSTEVFAGYEDERPVWEELIARNPPVPGGPSHFGGVSTRTPDAVKRAATEAKYRHSYDYSRSQRERI